MKAEHFSEDCQVFLDCLSRYRVKYLIIGGEAVIFYGHIRLTGDIDFFYEPSNENAVKLYGALNEFWEGNIPVINKPEDLLEPETVFQFGVPPNRIDLLNFLGDIPFREAWEDRKKVDIEMGRDKRTVYYIGLAHLIKNKQEANRARDREDLKFLLKIKPS